MKTRVQRFFANLGPGLITGAADDDPSGISTYSVAGAALGYSSLWLALLSYPMMAAVQIMCARLGLVYGDGLAGAIRRRYPPWILWVSCGLLAIANIVNIGADLSGMADAIRMVTGTPAWIWPPAIAATLLTLLIWSSYHTIVRIFKWLTTVLIAYVIAAFFSHPRWIDVLRATFIPHLEWSPQFLATFVAIMGTTISPYMFFWQAAQEVEDERAHGRRTLKERRGATDAELRTAHIDVFTGMAWAGVAMYFIILTTAATLHAHGHRDIETARDAALALRPLAGDAAFWLFTLGIVGTGMLGIPVLAGSAAYAIAEAMHWRGSLDDRPKVSRKFYGVVIASVLIGLALNLLRVNAVKALFWAAVLNGLLAPPLLALITLLTSDSTVMGDRVNPKWLKYLGWTTTGVMGFAALALLALTRF